MKDYGPAAVEQDPVFRVPGHRPAGPAALSPHNWAGRRIPLHATPVRSADGTVIASVSTSALTFRIPATRIPALAGAVRHAAGEVSRRLGWTAR